MNVAEFIKWLETQDQEAEVHVLKFVEGTGWEGGGFVEEVPVDPTNDTTEYRDFRGNPFTREDAPHFEKRYLILGDY